MRRTGQAEELEAWIVIVTACPKECLNEVKVRESAF